MFRPATAPAAKREVGRRWQGGDLACKSLIRADARTGKRIQVHLKMLLQSAVAAAAAASGDCEPLLAKLIMKT